MAFDWNDYHTLAQKLLKQDGTDDEARMRCAISRAYYCAFNIAKDYIRTTDSTVSSKISHFDLWAKFLDVEGKSDVETHGERARKLRVKADYDCHIARLEEDVKATFTHVKKVLAQIS